VLAGLYYLQRGAEALDVAEHDVAAHTTLGGSLRDLQRAAQLLPADPLPQRYLARLYMLTEQHREAVAALEQARRLSPQSLLVRKELMIAYQTAGLSDQASQLEADVGYTPDRIVGIGDAYREGGDYVEAARRYDSALEREPDLAPRLAFRRLLTAALSDDRRLPELLHEAQTVFPDLMIPRVGAEGVLLSGSMLRWLKEVPDRGILYGTPLNHPYYGSEAVFWWSGHATLLLNVADPGDYLVRMTVLNGKPAPIELAFGVNGTQLHRELFVAGDDSWAVVELVVPLRSSMTSLDVWYLNDAVVNGLDRDAVISQIEIRPSSVSK